MLIKWHMDGITQKRIITQANFRIVRSALTLAKATQLSLLVQVSLQFDLDHYYHYICTT